MPSIVIVALPEADSPLWTLSSEKKPHLTLLYIDAPIGIDAENIVQFVKHAAETSLNRFGLAVDRRETLGKDDADVLFFDDDFVSQELRKFRSSLLKNDLIAKHYVKADQFPGWIPHLTMGYPTNPAKKSSESYALSWVNFDRISVWLDDYDGPEFRLKSHDVQADIMHGFGDFVDSVKKGATEFKESAVVRDARGQFSKQAEKAENVDLDAEWDKFGIAVQKEFVNIVDDVLKKFKAMPDIFGTETTKTDETVSTSNGEIEWRKTTTKHSALAHGFSDFFSESKVVRDAKGQFSKIKSKISSEVEDFFIENFGDGKTLTNEQREKMIQDMWSEFNKKDGKQIFSPRKGNTDIFNPDAKLDVSQVDGQGRNKAGNIVDRISRMDDQLGDKMDNTLDPVEFDPNDTGKKKLKVQHSDILTPEEFLAHYGKKGMRWGVRNDKVSAAGYRGTGVVRTAGELSAKDGATLAKFVGNSHVYSNKIAPKVKQDVEKINAKYNEGDLIKDSVYSKYRTETNKVYEKYLNAELPDGLTAAVLLPPNINNPSYVVVGNNSGLASEMSSLKKDGFKHSDTESVSVIFTLTAASDNRRFITSMNLDSEVKHSDVDDFLVHYGRLGMRWGVRRPTGPDGLVKGSVPSTTKTKSDDPLASVIAKAKKGKNVSDDHKKMAKNLEKTTSQLSTADIKAINERIKAVNQLQANTKAAKDAKKTFGKKLVDFALGSVVTGAKRTADSYIQELTGDVLKDIFPDTPSGKLRKEKAKRDADAAAEKAKKDAPKDDAPKSESKKSSSSTGDVTDHPNYTTKPGSTKVEVGDPFDDSPSSSPEREIAPERQLALETLADQILRQSKGG